MNIETFEQNLKSLETNVIIAKQNKTMLEKDILSIRGKAASLETMNLNLDKITVILTQAAKASRDNARAHFEKIITDALQFVSQNKDYEFVIMECVGRAKASYEFFIKSTVNGIECIQKPEDANGGGFVDIISVAAKYAYLEIFNDPKIMSGTLLYDEPGKMISEQMSIKFAEYIKFLGNHYGRQTIMITHNENLSNVADKTFVVRKDRNGISTVTEQSTVAVNFDDMEDLLNEDTN